MPANRVSARSGARFSKKAVPTTPDAKEPATAHGISDSALLADAWRSAVTPGAQSRAVRLRGLALLNEVARRTVRAGDSLTVDAGDFEIVFRPKAGGKDRAEGT